VTGALPAVSWHIVWTAWSPRPAVLLVSVGLLVWYLRLARQLAAEWPRSRTWSWCVGIASFVWVGSGFPQVYDRSLYWVWTAQQLALLLVVPVLLMAGHPIALNSSRYGGRSRMNRLLGTGPVRLVSSPLVGPLLVPLIAAVLFFGPVPRWAMTVVSFGWLLQIALVVIGSAIALALVTEDARASLAIG
jgi:putative membrane protein